MLKDIHLQAFDSVVRSLRIVAYLCGGTVRDLLLPRQIHDVDVVLSDRVFEAAELFGKKLGVPSFVMDQERQVARVVFENGNWDFTGFRNHTIEGDLKKRDFTINAMAIRWEDFYPDRKLEPVIDPFDGRQDLKNSKITPVSSDSLADDPLRMVRAYRIKAELDFIFDPALTSGIEKLHANIAETAEERVREEVDRIFMQPHSATTWSELGESSLFDSMFPEMVPMKRCDQGGYHHLDVWRHTLLTLKNLEHLFENINDYFPDAKSRLQEYLEATPGTLDRKRILKWGTLLHDIGKPQTRELREPGRWRFHGHDHAGSDLASGMLKRLKFSRKDIQMIASLVEHHLRPLNLFNQPERTEDAYYRFFRATGAEGLGVLLMSYADITAARGPLADPQRDDQFITMLREMLRFYFDEYFPKVHTPELIKGRDLMAFLQMKPGPLMGEVLKEIREAQLTGQIRDRNEALDFARTWLRNRE